MPRIPTLFEALRNLALTLALAAGLTAAPASAAEPAPTAKPEGLNLFDAMDQNLVSVVLVHRDETAGNLIIKNLTSEPQSLEMPEAFVGIHVLHQFFPQAQQQQNNGNRTTGLGEQIGAGTGAQTTGGGASQQQSGNNQASGQGIGFFSIPAGVTVRYPVRSVCLEHGRPTPSPRMEYRIAPVERVTSDPRLKELLVRIGRNEVRQKPAQAIAWHLANGKSETELASLLDRINGIPVAPHFSRQDLREAGAVLQDIIARTASEQPVAVVSTSSKPGLKRPRTK